MACAPSCDDATPQPADAAVWDDALFALSLNRSAVCRVDRAEALRYLGYVDQPLTDDLRGRMERMFERCEEVARPAWCFQVFPVVHEPGRAILRGAALSVPTTGSAAPLARMSACAAMACTIGLSHDREAHRLAVSGPTDALVFDAAGSSLVEMCADACETAVYERARRAGMHAGQRTSPGYGELPLTASRDIVRLLDAGKRLGISVTESDLLVPQKSVTALVPLYDCEEDARRARRSCADCIVRANCAYLQAGNPCNP